MLTNPLRPSFLDTYSLSISSFIPDIGLGVRVFANGPGDLGSIIPKTQKMVLDASLLNTQHYKVRIKGKVEQSWEGVAPSPTPWCSSYRKGSLQVTLDYGRQLYLYRLSGVGAWHAFSCSVVHLLKFFARSLQKWSRVSYNPGIYPFDEISVI